MCVCCKYMSDIHILYLQTVRHESHLWLHIISHHHVLLTPNPMHIYAITTTYCVNQSMKPNVIPICFTIWFTTLSFSILMHFIIHHPSQTYILTYSLAICHTFHKHSCLHEIQTLPPTNYLPFWPPQFHHFFQYQHTLTSSVRHSYHVLS